MRGIPIPGVEADLGSWSLYGAQILSTQRKKPELLPRKRGRPRLTEVMQNANAEEKNPQSLPATINHGMLNEPRDPFSS